MVFELCDFCGFDITDLEINQQATIVIYIYVCLRCHNCCLLPILEIPCG
jgi:hypothetical protein